MNINDLLYLIDSVISQDEIISFVLIALLLLVAACMLYVLWRIPIRYISERRRGLQEKDILELENDYRATFAQILGGFLVLLGLFFTVSELRNNQRTFELNQRGQESERYGKAIELLSKSDPLNQIGGIMALETIAETHAEDYRLSVMKTFAAYVQVKSPWIQLTSASPEDSNKRNQSSPTPTPSPSPESSVLKPTAVASPSPDESNERNESSPTKSPATPTAPMAPEPISTNIQEVLTFIGKWPHTDSKGRTVRLNLSLTNLRSADMTNGHFTEVDFLGIYGASADFTRADLSHANFQRRTFPNGQFQDTYLKCAIFNQARLEQTLFNHANLSGANFYQAKLKNTVFANANVYGAYFQGADLRETDITQEQINSAWWMTELN